MNTFNQDHCNQFTDAFFNTCKFHRFRFTPGQKQRCMLALTVMSHRHQHGDEFKRIRDAELLALRLQRKVGDA